MAVRPLTVLVLAAMPLLLGGCAIPVAVSLASYAADGVLLLTTDKAGSDHLLSLGTGQDCAMWRVVKGREVCSDYKPGENRDPYKVDYDAPHREVGEGGMVTVYTAARQGGRLLSDAEAKDVLRGPPEPPPPIQEAAAPATPAPAADTITKSPTGRMTITRANTSSRRINVAAKSKPKVLVARRSPPSPASVSGMAVPLPISEPVAVIDPPVLSVAAAAPESWR